MCVWGGGWGGGAAAEVPSPLLTEMSVASGEGEVGVQTEIEIRRK